MRKRIEFSPNTRFGNLTAVAEEMRGQYRYVQCICDCGTQKTILLYSLTSGRTRSCGCVLREVAKKTCSALGKSNKTHADTASAEYRAWCGMLSRCYNERSENYHNYGGRGIAVCEEWLESYETFLANVGRRPTSSHSLERIDNNGNYAPNNVKWATSKEQARNRRTNRVVMFKGEEMVFLDACKMAGVHRQTALHRIKRGWSVDKALSP